MVWVEGKKKKMVWTDEKRYFNIINKLIKSEAKLTAVPVQVPVWVEGDDWKR